MKFMHPFRKLSFGNRKCDNADDDADDDDDEAGVMIPMCRPCFAGDTKIAPWGIVFHKHNF